MKKFDYSFLKNEKISSNIFSLLISIEKIQIMGTKNEVIYPKVYENIQEIANFQSTKFTNLLDGIHISDLTLESIISINGDLKSHSDHVLSDFYDILKAINNGYDKITFNSYGIRDIHNSIFGTNSNKYGGEFKNQDNYIYELEDDGTKTLIFKPTSSDHTSKAIDELLEAYKIAISDVDIPNLLLIPCFVLDFLLIYPFNEGNERISRLLSLLLLHKSGYHVGKYVSFDKQLYKDKKAYYDAIQKSSVNWENNNNNYEEFMEFFLKKIYACYTELNSRFKIVEGMKINKKKRVEETIMRSFEPISRKEIYLIWPDISHETIKKVVKNLLNENKIKKIGNFKDARYKRNWYGDRSRNEENIVIF